MHIFMTAGHTQALVDLKVNFTIMWNMIIYTELLFSMANSYITHIKLKVEDEHI